MLRPLVLALTLTLGLGLASGCSSAANPGASAPMDAAALFATISSLSALRPFTAAAVSRITGAKLKDTPQSNPYFTVQRAEKGAAGAFDSVEVREPTAQSAGKGGMILLTIADPCVQRAEVGDRFGAMEPTDPGPPSPHMPPDSPVYDTYPQRWGKLKLGYRPSTGCLVSVVMDGIG